MLLQWWMLHGNESIADFEAYIRSLRLYLFSLFSNQHLIIINSIIYYKTWTLLELGVSLCQTRIVSDTNTTTTHIVTLNYVYIYIRAS